MYRAITTLMLVCSVKSYFTYHDCDPDCIHYNASCVIVEINPNNFVNRCAESEDSCENIASPDIVCLRPGKEPLGGQNIWPDFDKHHGHPVPKATVEVQYWIMVIIAIISQMVVSVLRFICLLMMRRLQNPYYVRMPGEPNREIYREVVEDIEQ